MIRRLFYIIFICNCILLHGQCIQDVDSVFDMTYYKAYFSKEIKTSSYIIYKLYKGGGPESRTNLNFKKYHNLSHFNYSGSGYDRGHLLPAEDFAYDKDRMKSTFYYINCIPQTIKLNRGSWKKYETLIRQLSQTDSLLIICGGCNYRHPDILIPQNCFKLVYKLKNKECMYSLYFANDSNGTIIDINNKKLKRKFSYKKILKLYNK